MTGELSSVLLSNAQHLIAADDLDGAELLIDTHLSRHAEDVRALALRGLVRSRRGQAADADADFAAATRLAPRDPAIVVTRAQALAQAGRFAQALAALDAFLTSVPGQIDALSARVQVLQLGGQPDEAVATAQIAVAFNRESARAQLVLGTALLKARRPLEALPALEAAVARETTLVDAWVNLGVAQKECGRLAEAERTYRTVLAMTEGDPVIQNNLGNVLAALGRAAEAESAYRDALRMRPAYVDARVNLANALRECGDPAAALDMISAAPSDQQNHAGLLNAKGNALRSAERYDEAIAVLEQAAAASPDNAEVRNNLGLALAVKNRLEDAEPHFRRAVELKPDAAVISNNLGALLLRMFKFEDAIIALGNAVARDPAYDEAYCNQAVAHYMLGQAEQAIAIYRKVLDRDPKNGFARYGLAVTLLENQNLAEAEAEVRRVIAEDPGNAMAHNTLGVLMLDQHRIDDARAAMKAAADVNTYSAPIFWSNYAFASLYDPELSRQAIYDIHREFARRYASDQFNRARPHANARDPHRKLVLGYVSPDFRAHSVAYFFEALLEKHDRTNFKIVLYSNTTRKDSVTEAFKQAADVWVETAGLTDDAMLRRIREDGVDILVDLGGHTSGNRLPVLAYGPAPVQATYVGYADTTAVPAVGYRISDGRADPDSNYCTESVIRLPDCFHCYRPHGKAPAPAAAPHVAKGYVTFASFNVLPKVNDRTLDAWAEILKQVPESRFYIKCKQLRDAAVREKIRIAFRKRGVDPERIAMESFVPSVQEHLGQYALVDLALDTFPYNGTTTTCEAIWMGVPVLTAVGERHSSRVGLSLLTALGLADEFAAPSVDDYVARAVALGRKPARLAELRAQLRPKMAASPLRNEVGFTRNLESAYRKMWRDWCAGPATFERQAPPELRPEDSIQGVLVKTL